MFILWQLCSQRLSSVFTWVNQLFEFERGVRLTYLKSSLLFLLPDTPNREAKELQDPNEDVEFDETKASKTTHLTEIFEPSSENHGINNSALNDGSVIVEVHSLADQSISLHQPSKIEDAEVIVEETQHSQPIRNDNLAHVTAGVHHKKSEQSVNEELLSLLPPWKRQIVVNRMVKEKAREKAEREKV